MLKRTFFDEGQEKVKMKKNFLKACSKQGFTFEIKQSLKIYSLVNSGLKNHSASF